MNQLSKNWRGRSSIHIADNNIKNRFWVVLLGTLPLASFHILKTNWNPKKLPMEPKCHKSHHPQNHIPAFTSFLYELISRLHLVFFLTLYIDIFLQSVTEESQIMLTILKGSIWFLCLSVFVLQAKPVMIQRCLVGCWPWIPEGDDIHQLMQGISLHFSMLHSFFRALWGL